MRKIILLILILALLTVSVSSGRNVQILENNMIGIKLINNETAYLVSANQIQETVLDSETGDRNTPSYILAAPSPGEYQIIFQNPNGETETVNVNIPYHIVTCPSNYYLDDDVCRPQPTPFQNFISFLRNILFLR